MRTVNLEAGRPTVAEARARLENHLRTAAASGERVLKIIHGYGSSGKGGAIKAEVHRVLELKKREGKIRDYSKGEEFSPFYQSAREITAKLPELARDRDYSRANDGITVVLLR